MVYAMEKAVAQLSTYPGVLQKRLIRQDETDIRLVVAYDPYLMKQGRFDDLKEELCLCQESS